MANGREHDRYLPSARRVDCHNRAAASTTATAPAAETAAVVATEAILMTSSQCAARPVNIEPDATCDLPLALVRSVMHHTHRSCFQRARPALRCPEAECLPNPEFPAHDAQMTLLRPSFRPHRVALLRICWLTCSIMINCNGDVCSEFAPCQPIEDILQHLGSDENNNRSQGSRQPIRMSLHSR